jgi:hypothetical protein
MAVSDRAIAFGARAEYTVMTGLDPVTTEFWAWPEGKCDCPDLREEPGTGWRRVENKGARYDPRPRPGRLPVSRSR